MRDSEHGRLVDRPTRPRGVWGNRVQLPAAPYPGGRGMGAPLLKVQTYDGEPDMMCVQLGFDRAPDDGEQFAGAGGVLTAGAATNSPEAAVYADLYWTNNNAQYQARVDYRQGTIINIVAAELCVNASSECPFGGGIGTRPVVYGGVSIGSMISNVKPTRTIEALIPGTGAFEAIIPNFARSLQVIRAAPGPFTLAYTLVFEDNSGSGIGTFVVPAGSDMDEVPIPNRAVRVLISGTVADGPYELIFTLDL